MDAPHRRMIALNVLLGPAVLSSYVWCVQATDDVAAFWGELPLSVQPIYSRFMFVAAASYLVFTWFLLRRVDGPTLRARRVNLHYLLILVASTLWMPLTLAAIEAPPARAAWLVPLIWVVLGVVATGSLGMLNALRTLPGRIPGAKRATIAAALFCVQTVALDFLIWPWFFRP